MKTIYWDRRPGNFVNKDTGAPVAGPSFTGNQQEWYQSLYEMIIGNFQTEARKIFCSRDVLSIFENLVNFRPCFDASESNSNDLNENYVGYFPRYSYAYEHKGDILIKVYIDTNLACNIIKIDDIGLISIKGLEIF